MRRWLPWQDLVTFLAFPVMYTAFVVWALFTPQEWPLPKAVVMAAVGVIGYAVAACVLWRRWRTSPTFVLPLGTAVWTNGLPIELPDVIAAVGFYAANVGRAHRILSPPLIHAMLSDARIEFTKGPVLWGEEKFAGLQKARSVKVMWGDGFGYNAFFHELHHMVDERLLDRVDRRHEREDWWKIVSQLKKVWRDGGAKRSTPVSGSEDSDGGGAG